MSLHNGTPALLGEEEGHILPIILEEILGEHCRTLGVSAHGQILRPPRLLLAVLPHLEAMSCGRVDEPLSKSLAIGRGIQAHMDTPASGLMPLAIRSGSIVVDGYQEHILGTEFPAPLIDSPASLLEGDIGILRHNPLGIKTGLLELFHDGGSYLPGVPVFSEGAIRRPLSWSLGTMTVIN